MTEHTAETCRGLGSAGRHLPLSVPCWVLSVWPTCRGTRPVLGSADPDSLLFQLHDILSAGKAVCPRQDTIEPLQQTVAQGLEIAAAGRSWVGREGGGGSVLKLHSLMCPPRPFCHTQPSKHVEPRLSLPSHSHSLSHHSVPAFTSSLPHSLSCVHTLSSFHMSSPCVPGPTPHSFYFLFFLFLYH